MALVANMGGKSNPIIDKNKMCIMYLGNDNAWVGSVVDMTNAYTIAGSTAAYTISGTVNTIDKTSLVFSNVDQRAGRAFGFKNGAVTDLGSINTGATVNVTNYDYVDFAINAAGTIANALTITLS